MCLLCSLGLLGLLRLLCLRGVLGLLTLLRQLDLRGLLGRLGRLRDILGDKCADHLSLVVVRCLCGGTGRFRRDSRQLLLSNTFSRFANVLAVPLNTEKCLPAAAAGQHWMTIRWRRHSEVVQVMGRHATASLPGSKALCPSPLSVRNYSGDHTIECSL